MAPGSNKRKRPDRQTSHDDVPNRSSPHRPETLSMAQHSTTPSLSQHQKGSKRNNRTGKQSSESFGATSSPTAVQGVRSPTQPVQPQRGAGITSTEHHALSTPVRPHSPGPQQHVREGTIPPSPPYSYEYVTDAIIEGWQERGKELQETSRQADELSVGLIILELLRSAIDGRLDASEVGRFIQQMIAEKAEQGDNDIESLFLNTLSLLEDADLNGTRLLALLAATEIDPEVLRQELDVPLLQNLSLVRSTFERMRTRKTTNLLYRQANFNLLREETEGYAKLITEYFNTANDAVQNPDVSAEDAFQRVMALVGSFDLDVGRVLDITLDISANLLVRAYVFFVKFYRCSSWWPDSGTLDNIKWEDQGFNSFPAWGLPDFDTERPADIAAQECEELAERRMARDIKFWASVAEVGMDAFFNLGARRIIDFDASRALLEAELQPEFDSRNNEINIDRRKRINQNRKFMLETGTLPPQGNSDAAQLLGFKLRFYASSAREASDVLPENLVYLAALLIKIGFISFRDLYPHLYPSDEQMVEEKSRLEKEKREKEARDRPGGGANALAMAGALPDDTTPVVRNLRDKERSGGSSPKTEKKDEESKEELPNPTNQKLLLLKALLLIGALPEALYILGRFPWIAEVDASLPPYLQRIARHMLSKVVEATLPVTGRDPLNQSKLEPTDTPAIADSTSKWQHTPAKKTTRWLGLDLVDKTDGQTYRHYYSDWDDNIPLCQDVEDVFLLCNTFLGLLGVKVGQDAGLLSMLIQIAKHDLGANDSETNRGRWLELMKRLLVPALSLSKHNPGLTQGIYDLLILFPTTTRFNIYAEWYLGKTSRLPDMRVAFDHNRAEVKDVLRRVTNETSKRQARALAKVSFASPGVVMMSMINQLESYSNMIPSLVECTRYFSPLAWDVLTWCLLNSLSGQGRDRIQADGMLTSPWLQALSHFVATLFLRYSIINPSPVLQYLTFELRAGNSTDLEMLEQILAEMAGIKSDMEFNDAQVVAMAGGEHLQAQIVLQLADKRHTRKNSALRLVKALSDHGLIGQTLVAMAQERQMYSHRESSTHMPLKVLGNNLDKVQQVFAQYIEVLRTNLTVSEFEEAIPGIVSLVQDFGIEPGIAFTICRTVIVGRMNEFDTARKQESDESRRRVSYDKTENAVDQQRFENNSSMDHDGVNDAKKVHVPTEEPLGQSEEIDTQGAEMIKPTNKRQIGTDSQPWHPVLNSIIEDLTEAAPHLAAKVSIPFFATFWTLTLQDILVHTPSYDKEINKLRDQIKQMPPDTSDVSATAMKEKDRKRKAATEIQDNLREELKSRIAVYQKTRNRLSRREKDHWFSRSVLKEDIDAIHIGLLQECFLPRAMLSSLDAHYCYLMLKMLHDNGTPGFRTMHLLHHLLRKQELASIMFQCTAMEAQHFGRFLYETLKLLQLWHADKSVYEKEALGGKQKLPGFANKVDFKGEPESVIDYEQFRRLLFNWHSFLNGALQLCFESGEYMHIRNGIIVLRSVAQVFPALNFMGHNMVKHVTKLSEEDPRQDLKLAAMSLLGPLRSRENKWMMPQAFRLNDLSKEGGKTNNIASRTDAIQPSTDIPKLNATAAEFKSTSSSVVKAGTQRESGVGPEDGEIDEKPSVPDGDTEMKDAPLVSNLTAPASSETTNAGNTGPSTLKSEVSAPPTGPTQQPTKPATPGPTASAVPPYIHSSGRRESPRSPSLQSPASRSQHSLPARPEYGQPRKPFPPTSQTDRPGQHPTHMEERYGRLDRPNDLRPASREHSPSTHGYGRPSDREGYGRLPPRDERGPSREDRGSIRPLPRDDNYASNRHNQGLLPPRERFNNGTDSSSSQRGLADRTSDVKSVVAIPTDSRSGATNTTASQVDLQPSNAHRENPARLALINDDKVPEKSRDSTDGTLDSRRDWEARYERQPPRYDSKMPGRSAGPSDLTRDALRSDQYSDLAPTGPRHGRLSRDSGPAQVESSYGRLNTPQDAAGAQWPNGTQSRSARNFNSPQAPLSTRSHDPPGSFQGQGRSSDSQSSFRSPHPRQSIDHRRSSNQQFERGPPGSSVPTTPTVETATSQRSTKPDVQLPKMETAGSANGPRQADLPQTLTPAGPRAHNRPFVGPPSEPTTPNAGPSEVSEPSIEKQRRGDRQRASINATLQNGGTVQNSPVQTVNFRGAAQIRPPNLPSTIPAHPPALASSIETPPRRGESLSGRPDSRQDLFKGRAGRGEDGEGHANTRDVRRREEERFGPPHSSRNASRERPMDDGRPLLPMNANTADKRMPRDDRDLGEETRERRGMERHPRGDGMRPPTETPQSFSNGPPPMSGQGPEWARGDNRPPFRDDSRRGGRGHPRGVDGFRGPRREDDRSRGPPRDEVSQAPPPPYGTRKRRHEEFPYDEVKRRRGGGGGGGGSGR